MCNIHLAFCFICRIIISLSLSPIVEKFSPRRYSMCVSVVRIKSSYGFLLPLVNYLLLYHNVDCSNKCESATFLFGFDHYWQST